MEGEPKTESFDYAAMAESLSLTLERLMKMGHQLNKITFNNDEVDRRYEAGQIRLEHLGAEEIPLQIN